MKNALIFVLSKVENGRNKLQTTTVTEYTGIITF